MIGRKAIGNPSIFSKIQNKKINFEFKDWLKLSRKYNLPFRQIKFQAMNFSKGKRNSRKLRNEIAKTKSVEEIKNLI
jgi:tRNA-dihydrouridine synthase